MSCVVQLQYMGTVDIVFTGSTLLVSSFCFGCQACMGFKELQKDKCKKRHHNGCHLTANVLFAAERHVSW